MDSLSMVKKVVTVRRIKAVLRFIREVAVLLLTVVAYVLRCAAKVVVGVLLILVPLSIGSAYRRR